MKKALDQFHRNIGRANDLCGLYRVLQSQTTTALEISDILRAAVVMSVSALDHFVHETVRIGMLDAYHGRLHKADAFRRFSVSLASLERQSNDPAMSDWLDEEIRTRHGWVSFEHPDRIAEALRLVTDSNVWESIGSRMGSSAGDVKARLALIVDRRNKISHESDMDPSIPGERWPIDERLADDTVKFVGSIGDNIHDFLIDQYGIS